MSADVKAWTDAFATYVRARDLDGARSLFSDDCHAFGTNLEEADSLDALARGQWDPIWSSTEGFEFIAGSVRAIPARDGSVVCITARWRSDGINPDGSRFPREGRCTIVLRAAPESPFGAVAAHTHFSMSPPATAPEPSGDPSDDATTRG